MENENYLLWWVCQKNQMQAIVLQNKIIGREEENR